MFTEQDLPEHAQYKFWNVNAQAFSSWDRKPHTLYQFGKQLYSNALALKARPHCMMFSFVVEAFSSETFSTGLFLSTLKQSVAGNPRNSCIMRYLETP